MVGIMNRLEKCPRLANIYPNILSSHSRQTDLEEITTDKVQELS